MRIISKADVFFHGAHVGTIAQNGTGPIVFQYSGSWLSEGFSISPLSLPLQNRLFTATSDPFNGLFGVFDDCLPDGWGRLLTDRYLRSIGIAPQTVNAVTRLSLLSEDALGALEFRPNQFENDTENTNIDFDEIKQKCAQILADREVYDFDVIYGLGGSSGGARPKAHVNLNGESWIVKFPSSYDPQDIGLQEYRYMQAAKVCGLEVPEFRLLPSRLNDGYFAVKRFDRKNGTKIHMVSAGGLLETSHRFPALDYEHLFRLSAFLTHNNIAESEKLFTLMCFNEYAHNRDDHAKNFSFLYEPQDGWHLSPVYDLTYSNSLNGEHATTINGKGTDISDADIIAAGSKFIGSQAVCMRIMDKVKTIVKQNCQKSVESGI